MNLYILRHAIAVDKAQWPHPDSERPLTPEGIHKMRKAAKGLKSLKLGVDWILTSPYRRAYATAVIVAKTLKLEKKMKVVEALASRADPQQVVRELHRIYKSDATLLLVGHEPDLSHLISVLIGSRTALGLDLKKGGLCKLKIETLRYERCATLEWWLPPKLLRHFR